MAYIAPHGTSSDSLHTPRPGNRYNAYSLCVSGLIPFLGGAERLVVDAAAGLQKLGHNVKIYTSHHDPPTALTRREMVGRTPETTREPSQA